MSISCSEISYRFVRKVIIKIFFYLIDFVV